MAGVSGDGGYAALRDGLAALEIERDVVRVTGPDAESYLQGQTSQDISKLGPGGSAWALVLQPQGKVDAFVRVYRAGPAEFLLDTDPGMGASLVARLARFKLRTKANIQQLDWRAVAVRGQEAGKPPAGTGEGVEVAVPFEWGGLTGYDLFGPEPTRPTAAAPAEPAAYEAVRVEAGFPRHGHELDDRTIPAEAGLVEAAVSFTKGCYTGQELVDRIDSRGSNVPRHLRGLLLSAAAPAGTRLYQPGQARGAPSERDEQPGAGGEGSGGAGGKDAGRLTSVARSPRLGWVALGYVGRGVEVGSTVVARDGKSEVQAQVERLPLT